MHILFTKRRALNNSLKMALHSTTTMDNTYKGTGLAHQNDRKLFQFEKEFK